MATLFDMDGVALWGLGLHPFWLKVIPSVGVVQITYEILSLFFFRIYTPSTIKAVTKAKKVSYRHTGPDTIQSYKAGKEDQTGKQI